MLNKIQECINAINIASPITFSLNIDSEQSLSCFSDREHCIIHFGACMPTLAYIYCNFNHKDFHNYILQNLYAQKGMYSEAIGIITTISLRKSILGKLMLKLNKKKSEQRISDLIILSIFHEIGHIVFCHDSNIKNDYLRAVNETFDILEEVIASFNLQDIIKDSHVIEEIASDYYAIDQIFKVAKECQFSSAQVYRLCCALIDMLTFVYELQLMYNNIDDIDVVFEQTLPLFSLRRMIVFNSMVDVLTNEYGYSDIKFDRDCSRIVPKPDELKDGILKCKNALVKMKSWDYFNIDTNKSKYDDLISAFNYKNTSNYLNF